MTVIVHCRLGILAVRVGSIGFFHLLIALAIARSIGFKPLPPPIAATSTASPLGDIHRRLEHSGHGNNVANTR